MPPWRTTTSLRQLLSTSWLIIPIICSVLLVEYCSGHPFYQNPYLYQQPQPAVYLTAGLQGYPQAAAQPLLVQPPAQPVLPNIQASPPFSYQSAVPQTTVRLVPTQIEPRTRAPTMEGDELSRATVVLTGEPTIVSRKIINRYEMGQTGRQVQPSLQPSQVKDGYEVLVYRKYHHYFDGKKPELISQWIQQMPSHQSVDEKTSEAPHATPLRVLPQSTLSKPQTAVHDGSTKGDNDHNDEVALPKPPNYASQPPHPVTKLNDGDVHHSHQSSTPAKVNIEYVHDNEFRRPSTTPPEPTTPALEPKVETGDEVGSEEEREPGTLAPVQAPSTTEAVHEATESATNQSLPEEWTTERYSEGASKLPATLPTEPSSAGPASPRTTEVVPLPDVHEKVPITELLETKLDGKNDRTTSEDRYEETTILLVTEPGTNRPGQADARKVPSQPKNVEKNHSELSADKSKTVEATTESATTTIVEEEELTEPVARPELKELHPITPHRGPLEPLEELADTEAEVIPNSSEFGPNESTFIELAKPIVPSTDENGQLNQEELAADTDSEFGLPANQIKFSSHRAIGSSHKAATPDADSKTTLPATSDPTTAAFTNLSPQPMRIDLVTIMPSSSPAPEVTSEVDTTGTTSSSPDQADTSAEVMTQTDQPMTISQTEDLPSGPEGKLRFKSFPNADKINNVHDDDFGNADTSASVEDHDWIPGPGLPGFEVNPLSRWSPTPERGLPSAEPRLPNEENIHPSAPFTEDPDTEAELPDGTSVSTGRAPETGPRGPQLEPTESQKEHTRRPPSHPNQSQGPSATTVPPPASFTDGPPGIDPRLHPKWPEFVKKELIDDDADTSAEANLQAQGRTATSGGHHLNEEPSEEQYDEHADDSAGVADRQNQEPTEDGSVPVPESGGSIPESGYNPVSGRPESVQSSRRSGTKPSSGGYGSVLSSGGVGTMPAYGGTGTIPASEEPGTVPSSRGTEGPLPAPTSSTGSYAAVSEATHTPSAPSLPTTTGKVAEEFHFTTAPYSNKVRVLRHKLVRVIKRQRHVRS